MSIFKPKLTPEEQYLQLLSEIYYNGTDIQNERTGISCRTIINADLVYDASTNKAPLLTTRKAPTVLPIAELLGYIRGYTSAMDFRKLGTKSWDANANENKSWLANPARVGTDDMGVVYGAVARNWPAFSFDEDESVIAGQNVYRHTHDLDLFRRVYNNIKSGVDTRGEIITFWNPGLFDLGCLRPCLHTYQFSLIGDDLYLNAFQRSADVPLGLASNMVQVYVFLRLMAQITGKNPKMAYHKVVNAHIYQNQLEGVAEQIKRTPLKQPELEINPEIKTLEDVETWVTPQDFQWTYDEYHPAISFPFTV